MIAILSIDFDYFIAANAQERDEYFLRGGESIPREELPALWAERYAGYPQISAVDVIPEFSAFRAFLRSLNLDAAKVFLSETHRSIKQVIDRLPRGEPLRFPPRLLPLLHGGRLLQLRQLAAQGGGRAARYVGEVDQAGRFPAGHAGGGLPL
jgi:hypothetical protein